MEVDGGGGHAKTDAAIVSDQLKADSQVGHGSSLSLLVSSLYRRSTDILPVLYRCPTDVLPMSYRYPTDILPISYRHCSA